MDVMVINLDRHPERLIRITKILREFEIKFERVRAVDGNNLGTDRIYSLVSDTPRYSLSRYEVACMLSHRAAWARFLAGGKTHCCILEDDVRLSAGFRTLVESKALLESLPFHIIKLETMRQPVWLRRESLPLFDGHRLARLTSTSAGAAGYILNRDGATRLMELTVKMDRAVDDIMFDDEALRSGGLAALQLVPAVCIQEWAYQGTMLSGPLESAIAAERDALRSAARKKRKGLGKFLRELARPIEQLSALVRRLKEERMVVPFAGDGAAVDDAFSGCLDQPEPLSRPLRKGGRVV